MRAPSLRVLRYLRQLIYFWPKYGHQRQLKSAPHPEISGIRCLQAARPQYVLLQPSCWSLCPGYGRPFHSSHYTQKEVPTTSPDQSMGIYSVLDWRRRRMDGRAHTLRRHRYTVPTRHYQKKRREIRAKKGTAATRWMRHIGRRISQGNTDGAEELWHLNRVGGRDLEDLRQASKALMKAYNAAGRWLDTIRLFKWNEVAAGLDARGKRRMRDVISLKETGNYLKELELRAKLQKMIVDQWANVKPKMGSSVDTTLGEMRRDTSDADFDAYFQDLRDTLLLLRRIPTRFKEEIPIKELQKFMGDHSSPKPFTSPEEGKSEIGIDGELLDLCFKALLGRSEHEIILTLFYQYQPSVRLTSRTWEYMLAAYVNLGKLKKAEGLIRYTVFREISISPRCYSVLLSAISADGSWAKMERHFGWLEKISRSSVPAIYHIMIQTAIERGMKDEANKYFQRMRDRGLPWTAKTCGALLSVQAKVNDWESLQETLAIMDAQGFTIPRGSFNTVLNAYAEAKVYGDTQTFLKFGLERGIIPDKFTYNIMIKASIYASGAGAEDFLPYWLQQMIAQGILPDHYTFNSLFQDLRQNYGASASLLRRTYQKILRMQTSVKVLDHASKEMLLKSVHHETKWYSRTYKALRASDVRNTEAVALRMASAIEANKPDDALSLWKEFSQKQTPSFQMIILALRASLVAKERSSLVSEVLKAAKSHGLTIPHSIISVIRDSARKLNREEASDIDNVGPLFTGYDESTTLRYDRLYARVEEAYKFLDKHALPITHHVAVHSANRLINANQPHAAIELLNQVAKSKWGRPHPYDHVGYSVIMKAYCIARDLNGIKWTVERVIDLRLRPTTGIFSALATLKKSYLHESDENQAKFVNTMALRLRSHVAKLEQSAKKKAEFLVDFIRGTVGIKNKRRYGTNWPLVTSGTRKGKDRRGGYRITSKLTTETKVQTKGRKTTPYTFILRALERERERHNKGAKDQMGKSNVETMVVNTSSSLSNAVTRGP